MNSRRSLIGFSVASAVLGWCAVAAAWAYEYPPVRSAPDPTDVLIRYGIWSTLILLSAFIERPFYSQAGVERQALACSLRANLASTAAWWIGIAFADAYPDIFGLFGLFGPFAIAIPTLAATAIEYATLAISTRRRIDFRILLFGNVCSFIVLVAICIVAASPLGDFVNQLLRDQATHLAYAALGLSAFWIFGSIIAPLVYRRSPGSRANDPHDADAA